MTENIYKYAIQNKLRFAYNGMIGVEDLFDLSTSALDKIYTALTDEKDNLGGKKSLLSTVENKNDKKIKELDIKIAIVEDIFNQKVAERNAKLEEKDRAEKRRMLLELKAQKQNDAMKEMSIEDIDKMIAELN